MQASTQIVQSFGFFCRHNPVRLIGIFMLTLMLGISQGVSIVLLIPLLGMLDKTQPLMSHNKIAEWLQMFLDRVGFSLSLELILACFVVLLIGIALLGYFRVLWQSEYEQGFIYALRNRLFRKIVMSDWDSLTNRSRHMHLQVLSSEIPKLSNYYFALMNLLTSVILISANVALSMLVSVKFTVLVLLIGGIGFVFLKRFLLKSLSLGGFDISIFRQMNKQVDDFWTMIKPAKVHNAERFYSKRYEKMNLRMFDLQRKLSKNRAKSQLIFTTFGVIGLVVVVYLGCRVDTLSFTSIFVLILLFARLFPLFTGCNTYLDMIGSNFPSAHLVLSMDRELQDDGASEQLGSKENLQGDVRLEKVSFMYENGGSVFKSMDMVIPVNSITGIVGLSGSGKTTLLDMITGLLQPQEGKVFVGVTPLTKVLGACWRQNIGYLTQDTYFVDGSLRENLTWDAPFELTDVEIMDALNQVGVSDVVEREKDGLDTVITNYSFHFSGGERQRLALARVLLRRPKVLLLDEATSALDFQTESLVMQCLMRLKQNMTIVFVTHRETLQPWFDRVIDLNKLEKS